MRLSEEEVTGLLVATSQMDGGGADHAIIRDPSDGSTLAIYLGEVENPLAKGTDWWFGPAVLLAVILILVGAYTIGRGLVTLLF